jgi:hypothetical protein
MVTSVLQFDVFPQASVTVQVIVDAPMLKEPLASVPIPVRFVAPVIENEKDNAPPQLAVATIAGIVYVPATVLQYVCAPGHEVIEIVGALMV